MNMKLRLLSPLTLIIFASLFLFAGTSTPVLAQECDTVTDSQIVTTVLQKIKADSSLSAQISHIVVGSVNKFVKLQGWTDTKRGYDRLISIVSSVKCVKAINVNQFEPTPPPPGSPNRPHSGGCPMGMKACGDVCIPDGDSCSDISKSGSNE